MQIHAPGSSCTSSTSTSSDRSAHTPPSPHRARILRQALSPPAAAPASSARQSRGADSLPASADGSVQLGSLRGVRGRWAQFRIRFIPEPVYYHSMFSTNMCCVHTVQYSRACVDPLFFFGLEFMNTFVKSSMNWKIVPFLCTRASRFNGGYACYMCWFRDRVPVEIAFLTYNCI
eukprot:COSAG02_NODE_4230_length_5609_cov_6.098911_1_plen_175_part_00